MGSALAAFIILTPAGVVGADEPPPYASATEAYRQGASAMKSGELASAVPALEYAAKRGVLGAQLKLARLYASGRDVPKDDAKRSTTSSISPINMRRFRRRARSPNMSARPSSPSANIIRAASPR
ncbi:hypothetical protein AUC69_12845 [Methyloceanibacter superfactus]|uniref:Sel1 repeat family protein n=1 Tax=Methyloceanibacter superfactus TaxID=1774969 RepID=A0A1E3VU10_9HYPH|nr:sel1 repeat family protein [Methyloceanibacter superfactus]ODR97012.1 hypothetical protein AUC69_12845 [Methyloceanibacter superfactus]